MNARGREKLKLESHRRKNTIDNNRRHLIMLATPGVYGLLYAEGGKSERIYREWLTLRRFVTAHPDLFEETS